jgi:RTX calcium-binding nonapeptide repeat (4 copies)
LALGYSDAFYSNIIESGSSTYDAIAMMKFTLQNLSGSNAFDAWNQFVDYSAGLGTVYLASEALASFMMAAYGGTAYQAISLTAWYDETILGRVELADELSGTEDADLIHGGGGDDTIYGSDGGDLIDGAEGRDVVDYSTVGWGNRFILKDDVQSTANYIGSVVSTRLFPNDPTALFGIEEIRAGAEDDEVQLMGLPTTLERIDGGVQGDLGDLMSAFYADEGILFDMQNGTLTIGEAEIEVTGFERVEGSGHDDTITGDGEVNAIKGGYGADQLFGGGADDFIFFDAEDTVVNGGAGRDVGWALTGDPIMADLVAMAMEVLIGGGGADTIILSGGTEPLFAAGGAGNDTFVVTHNDIEGPKILWGGAGADTFEFNQTDPEYRWEQVGIAVVHIAALTEEMFATLTLGALGLAGIDLTKIDAIILNPDAGDQFRMDGGLLSTHSINLEEFDITTGPGYHLVDDFDTPASFEVRSSGFLGETQAIQSVFFNEIRFETTYWELYDYYQIGVTASGVVDVMETESFTETGGIANLEEAIALALENSQAWFQENEPYWVQQETSDSPYYAAPFFVVGGRFAGATLIDDGSLVATPEDPGTTAFDWLLAA